MAFDKRSPWFGVLFALLLVPGLAGCNNAGNAAAKEDDGAAEGAKEGHGKAAAKGAHGVGPTHWEYTGAEGQRNWGEISDEYAACVDGAAQSPINIAFPTAATLGKIAFNYKRAPVKVQNNGHTIQANYLPESGYDGGGITVENVEYKLIQFHLHRPSEHTINGRQFPMELHLVHKAANNKLAVVGLLIDQGEANETLEPIFKVMPNKVGEATVADEAFNAAPLLPKNTATYRYAGSLTTPPCSEGVSWMLIKTPIAASAAQIKTFRKLFEFNARYTQPLNGRDVYEDVTVQ